MAPRKDISVSEYCLRAITTQLMKEQEMKSQRRGDLMKTAIEKAYRFRSDTFRGKVFSISSADLIREARESRSP
jgi:hypothetical protein